MMKAIVLLVTLIALLAAVKADCPLNANGLPDLFCYLGVSSQTIVGASVTTGPAGGIIRGYNLTALPSLAAPRYIQFTGGRIAAGGGAIAADALAFGIDDFDIAGYFLAYFAAEASVRNNISSASAAAVAFGVRFIGIAEYLETNGKPGFQLNDDTLVGGYNFSNTNCFGPMITNSQTVGSTTTRSVTAVTVDNVFAFRVTSTGSPVTVNGVNIDANSVKLDVLINYYNPLNVQSAWSSGASAFNSTIALVLGVGGFVAGATVNTNSGGDPLGNGFKNVGLGLAGQSAGFQYTTNFTLGNAQTFNFVGAVAGTWHDNITSGIAQYDSQFASGSFAAYGGVQLAIFSASNQVRPGPIFWDPTSTVTNANAAATTTTGGGGGTTGAAIINAPVALFVLIAMFIALINKKF